MSAAVQSQTSESPAVAPRTGAGMRAGALAVRVGAEFVGSFLICFGVYVVSTIGSALYVTNLAYLAVATGLIYAVATTVFGGISGGQFNPAVTVAAMLASKTRVLDGVLYIIAQVLGSLPAAALICHLLPTSDSAPLSIWLTPAVNGFDNGSVSYSGLSQVGLSSFGVTAAIAVEVVAGILIVGAAMRTTGEHGESTMVHAVAMGVAYGVGAAIAYPVTGAALNPARATGLAVFAQGQGLNQEPLDQLWVFWVCPILAAALVALPMVIAQMMRTPASADGTAAGNETDAVATGAEPVEDVYGAADTVDAGDAAEPETGDVPSGTGEPAGAEASDQHEDAEVGDQQPDAERDADEGVETH